MPLTKAELTHHGARLRIVATLLQAMLADLPALLTENGVETMTAAERRFQREKYALYKRIVQEVRASGGAPATAPEITREEAGRLYFDAETAMARLTECLRKLQVLSADKIEDVPTTPGQRTQWEAALTQHLATLDGAIDAFPDSEGGER